MVCQRSRLAASATCPHVPSEHVSRRKIVILADNDEAGREHAEQKAALCNGIAASVRVVHFPDLPSKGDVSDWFGLGHTAGELTAATDATPPWTPPPSSEIVGEPAPKVAERSLVLNRLSDVEMRAVDRYWRARLAAGKHTALAGDPGAGKSSVTIAIAAAFTTGGAWPCGEGRAPVGNVIVLSAEDGEADTIKPRLVAAGGNPSRVYVISATKHGEGQRTFNLQADLDLLERAIQEIGDVLLVIIDPVSSYLGKVDGHKNSEVRGVLEPLSVMAARLGVAILSVTHFSKDGSGKSAKALHRFVGSIAFIGAPRMAFTVMPDPEDATRSLFLHVKNNLAAPPKGLAFRKEQREAAPGIIAAAIVWESSYIETTADETLTANDGGGGRTAKEDAADFLEDLLGRGPIDLLDVEEQARAAGLLGDGQRLRQNKAFRAAREAVGVLFEREGFGKGARYILRLPDAPCAPSNAMRALSPDGAHMGGSGRT
jgi:putative DNA primase/helicase